MNHGSHELTQGLIKIDKDFSIWLLGCNDQAIDELRRRALRLNAPAYYQTNLKMVRMDAEDGEEQTH